MQVVMRYRRDGEFVEPTKRDLEKVAARYVQALANARFGDEFSVKVESGDASDDTDHKTNAAAYSEGGQVPPFPFLYKPRF